MNTFEGSDEKVQLHVRISRFLKEFLDEYAQEQETTMSNLIVGYVYDLYVQERVQKEKGDVDSI